MYVPINLITTLSHPGSSHRGTAELSLSERKHIHYLNAKAGASAVSERIREADQVLGELNQLYGENYITHVTELDIKDEIHYFNNNSGYEKLLFSDWFAIRDYKESSYMRVNTALRNGHSSNEDRTLIHHLTLALMHLSMMQTQVHEVEDEEEIVYRGEVRLASDITSFQEGDIYISPAFMSASQNESIAETFRHWDASLQDKLLSVIYEIEKTTPLSSTNISQILRDGEEEIVFLPSTRFVITDVEQEGGIENTWRIKMRTCDVEQHTWDSHLYRLIRQF